MTRLKLHVATFVLTVTTLVRLCVNQNEIRFTAKYSNVRAQTRLPCAVARSVEMSLGVQRFRDHSPRSAHSGYEGQLSLTKIVTKITENAN